MVERALPASIVGAAIVFALATAPAGADRVATREQCGAGSNGVTPVLPGRGGAVELEVGSVSGLVSGRPVEWQFTVTNFGVRAAHLLFASAQFGDVILRAARKGAMDSWFREDDPVYRWSARRKFVQPLIWAVLPAHSSWRCSLASSTLDVAPGRYLLDAYVNARSAARPSSIMLRRYVDVAPAP